MKDYVEQLTVAMNHHLYVAKRFDSEFLKTARLNVEHDYASLDLVATLDAFIHGNELERKEVTHPTTWVDAIKDRFLPTWAKKYVATHYTTHTWKVVDYYPNAKVYEGWKRECMGDTVRVAGYDTLPYVDLRG